MIKNKKEIDQVINKFVGKKGSLIPLLQEIQAIEKYLSKDVMRYVSEKTGVRLAQIYGVATFYTMFRLKPQGKHVIRVCKGTACHVSDANGILKAINNFLNLPDDQDTTKDGLFTVVEVACLGCCSLAPVIMVDDNTHGKLLPENIPEILKKFK
ncbi:MAG: NADH-quinone oxidoreductase subunit NuoE [Candidatus Cloacimonetes bacterium]|nr:NADH-quinone oxidoreductase subunit NuoE [Candidatus Cloacimonadota bacterium]MCF7814512.1 NADH-quinone oxidoreductase subunit NuoE [Candidatus Cloacimonadota bacterium]MCF7869053.1 NADH-quinone oxidoreductase subunit NuoE [Candidatus Cloacimonadota bacterium]MCF7884448.1 NADH-quinone oxidoreductase subunit NuoE [Candidatus Cloacimonadota bacterium]